MRKLATTLLGAALLALALAPQASAKIGFEEFDVTFTEADESPAFQAGSHPFATTTSFEFTRVDDDLLGEIPDEAVKNLLFGQIPGLVGDATAVPPCTTQEFLEVPEPGILTNCSDEAIVGEGIINIPPVDADKQHVPVYYLTPPHGFAARLGFKVLGIPISVNVSVSPDPPYNLLVTTSAAPQTIPFYGAEITIQGDPSGERPFLTLPRACPGPLETTYSLASWQNPDDTVLGSILTHDDAEPPAPKGFEECETLDFAPDPAAAPTTNRAESPSGFDFSIDVEDPGLTESGGRADSDLKKAVVTLPEGLTVNPSAANGLEACSTAELDRETASSAFGEGCPAASRVADVGVTTPLLTERLGGSIFLARPYENPLGSLLAGYLVIKQPERGIVVKLTGEIEADPGSGQLTASFDQNPQLPFEHLEVTFPGGPGAALSTPQTCGDYEVETALHPWSGNAPLVEREAFEVSGAPGGGNCPTSEAALPHAPGFEAGTVAPLAGRYSPFLVNLRRSDGSQRFAQVSLNPPPGLVAKLAGTPACPEAALAAAARRDGAAEQRDPSCPAASRVGSVFAAAGSGPDPYWAPGTAYLAGPYKGAPLSIAVISPAVAGPFDLGTIVVRTAVHVDPRTALITAISDPLPEILEGIPLDVRTVSIRLDKPQFSLNPTSCDPMAVGGLLTSTRGQAAPLASRFQVAECGRLGFKPRIGLRIFGGVKRGKYQALRAVVRPRPGDANIGRTVVRFPRTAFVAQENFRTICTRVQFAADACPKGSVYGRAVAYSPLLDYPLAGNVYLRSSDNTLPDVVADLRGPAHQPIRIELIGRTDSVKGALRNTFDVVPDAPVSYFRLNLFGGRKSLIVNSRNVCAGKNRAAIGVKAQSGVRRVLRPRVLNPRCKKVRKQAKRKRAKQRRQARRSAVRRVG